MIDYEKLQLAHELADKLATIDCYWVSINVGLFSSDDQLPIFSLVMGGRVIDESRNIDDLITKLKELTKSKPKYKVGDIVYAVCIDNFELIDLTVESIALSEITNSFNYAFTNSFSSIGEEQLYPTKPALIEAQIEHWLNIRARYYENDVKSDESKVDVDGCQHESDGLAYPRGSDEPLGPYEFIRCKCTKCGEFYR